MMLDAGVSPTASTYNIYIRALCEFRRMDDARRVLLGMSAPDVVSYMRPCEDVHDSCKRIRQERESIHGYCNLR